LRAASDEFVTRQAAVTEGRVAGHEFNESRPIIVNVHVDFLVVQLLIVGVIIGRVRQQTVGGVSTLIHQPLFCRSTHHPPM